MQETFGGFVRQRRKSLGISLRGLAARTGLSPVYMSNIETDHRAAPGRDNLERLAAELRLSGAELERFYDLAAKSKTKAVSLDLPDYIMEKDIVRAALRTAREVDATDEEWQEFIDRIRRRSREDGR